MLSGAWKPNTIPLTDITIDFIILRVRENSGNKKSG
jgi:hypothetical protein